MKIELFKKKLEEEKMRLESEMGTIGRKSPTVPGDWELSPLEVGMESDPVDQADIIIDHENNVAVLAALEARYDAILATLSRIGKKTYGKCTVCGDEIGEDRLEADPAATTCVKHLS